MQAWKPGAQRARELQRAADEDDEREREMRADDEILEDLTFDVAARQLCIPAGEVAGERDAAVERGDVGREQPLTADGDEEPDAGDSLEGAGACSGARQRDAEDGLVHDQPFLLTTLTAGRLIASSVVVNYNTRTTYQLGA
jgi:hypothetical protein